MYSGKAILFIRGLTPLHVGVGRGYSAHVDLPVQRDEFGYPTIWSSSLKGAVKARLGSMRMCLGPDPETLESVEDEAKHSHIVFTDARLLLMPVRSLQGVYVYVTSLHLLNEFKKYLEATGVRVDIDRDLINKIDSGIALVSKSDLLYDKRLIINEEEIEAEFSSDLLSKIKLDTFLPDEIKSNVTYRGLVILPDKNDTSLRIINKSMMIQYRIALQRETKTVKKGALWGEEYVPAEAVFVSALFCSEREIKSKNVKCSCENLCDELDQIGIIFVGGRETIGRGLVKFYAKRYT